MFVGHRSPSILSSSSSQTNIPSEEEELSGPDAGNGRLWYSVLYNQEMEQLAVTLIKVKDLPGRQIGRMAARDFHNWWGKHGDSEVD